MEFRNARHTNDLQSIVKFYTNILGLEVLFSFENHNDYSGAFIGKSGRSWHLEFTMSKSKAHHSFDPEDLLVFYPKKKSEFDEIVARIDTHKIEKLKAANPFWDDHAIMIKDPDGFRVVVSNMKSK